MSAERLWDGELAALRDIPITRSELAAAAAAARITLSNGRGA
jgi:hypothetical protein